MVLALGENHGTELEFQFQIQSKFKFQLQLQLPRKRERNKKGSENTSGEKKADKSLSRLFSLASRIMQPGSRITMIMTFPSRAQETTQNATKKKLKKFFFRRWTGEGETFSKKKRTSLAYEIGLFYTKSKKMKRTGKKKGWEKWAGSQALGESSFRPTKPTKASLSACLPS